MSTIQNLISADKITRKEGGKILFKEVTFGIAEGEKVALIGTNGSGKSTLMKVLAGQKPCDEGRIARRKGLTLSMLEQSPEIKSDQTILDFVMESESPRLKLVRDYERALRRISGDDSQEALSELERLMEALEKEDCWNLERKISEILTELGISDLNLLTSSLSGGMLKKASIARALVQEADILLLDEPTNHLDLETIRWLEKQLKESRQTVVLVTHDRYFLENICTRIIEVDEGQIYLYNGNYSFYIEEKSRREEREAKEQQRIKTVLKREVEWLKRGPKARTGKDRGRKERAFKLMDSVKGEAAQSAAFSVSGRRLGGKILRLEEVSKGYDGKSVIDSFSYEFRKGERIGIMGANGSGKSTLLNLLTGRLEGDSGKVDRGINTHISYFDQMSHQLPGEMKVLDYIKEKAHSITLADGSTLSPTLFLERFLFPKELFYTDIGNLSGGEKRRLYLMRILMENPNFLVLDEPTNDLDIRTLSLLEDFLMEFDGCLIVVSHDRYFLDRTVDTLFCLDGNGNVTGFAGSISNFYEEKEELAAQPDQTEPLEKKKGRKEVNRKKKGLSFKEKQELEAIEPELYNLEEEKSDLEAFFASGNNDPAGMSQKQQRYSEVEQRIDFLLNRWEELEALNATD